MRPEPDLHMPLAADAQAEDPFVLRVLLVFEGETETDESSNGGVLVPKSVEPLPDETRESDSRERRSAPAPIGQDCTGQPQEGASHA